MSTYLQDVFVVDSGGITRAIIFDRHASGRCCLAAPYNHHASSIQLEGSTHPCTESIFGDPVGSWKGQNALKSRVTFGIGAVDALATALTAMATAATRASTIMLVQIALRSSRLSRARERVLLLELCIVFCSVLLLYVLFCSVGAERFHSPAERRAKPGAALDSDGIVWPFPHSFRGVL